jgi:hypothetical protein
MDKYRRLIIEESNLYSNRFIHKYGVSGQHWAQRELSLRHDMVCSLLCNLVLKRKAIPLVAGASKIARASEDIGEASTSRQAEAGDE